MPDIDEMWEKFLDGASRHHIPEETLQEMSALKEDLGLEPVLGRELCDELCDMWENGC